MKNKVFKETLPILIKEFGESKSLKIMNYADKELKIFYSENKSQTKKVKAHTFAKIYPCISIYRGIIKCGIEQSKALEFMDFSCSKRAEKQANSIKTLLKIPNLYKMYPRIFSNVAVKQFGEKAGFKAKFYKTEKTRSKFDMTKCLYFDVCKANGCAELTKCFCHTDDVCNADIHKNLKWNRTKTIGEGADFCDFDLFVK